MAIKGNCGPHSFRLRALIPSWQALTLGETSASDQDVVGKLMRVKPGK